MVVIATIIIPAITTCQFASRVANTAHRQMMAAGSKLGSPPAYGAG